MPNETVRPPSSKNARDSIHENTKNSFLSNVSKKTVGNQNKSLLKTQSVHSAEPSKRIALVKKHFTNQNQMQVVNQPSRSSDKISGPRTFSKTNPEVISKLLDNLPRKGMISKSNKSSNAPTKENKKLKSASSNELVKVVSSKDTASEFDKWVQERSFKIKKIHEELSKLVEDRVETYETSNPSVGSELDAFNR